MLILHSGLWSVLAQRLNRHQQLSSADTKYCTGNDSICSLSDIFFEFPVFRRHLSFFWVGLVQDKGFRPPTPIQSLQKGHLIMATGRLVSACAGKQRPFLSPVCYLHSKEKLQSLQVSLRLQHRIFLGLYSLSFFFFFLSTSFHLLLPWRMKCLFHSSCRLNRF